MVSDVEKAFLQICLQYTQRDVTRFLWLRDWSKEPTPDNLIRYRFCRVPFGYISSPFLLAGSIEHLLRNSDSSVSKKIMGNVYVDNVLGSAETVPEASEYSKVAVLLFSSASMNLREWFSNSEELMANIDEPHRGKGHETKVMGLKWNLKTDQVSCSVGADLFAEVDTKRKVLKAIASVYDPCGFLSPLAIHGKILMQQLWSTGLSWDEKLSAEQLEFWFKCSDCLSVIPGYVIPRQFGISALDKNCVIQLHCFCDASSTAYAAVVYLWIESSQGTKVEMLFSKTRVSPLSKHLCIPRLELMAALVGARLLKFVELELRLPVAKRFLWCDNQAVLYWITGSETSSIFVRNRVREIRAITDVQYLYVKSEHNPADLPSRGISAKEFSSCPLWWHGPSWLSHNSESWPRDFITPGLPTQVSESTKEENNALLSARDETVELDSVFEITRYSSLMKLLRITCYILRFITRYRVASSSNTTVTATEIESARSFWEKRIQKQHFQPLLDNSKSKTWIQIRKQLGIFTDSSGFLRCRGRFQYADMSEEAKCPKLLPKKSYFTDLVVKDTHAKLLHAGLKHTLAQVRMQYWIPHGRSTVKRILKGCKLCQKYDGGPFRIPEAPPLPNFRVTKQRPFAVVGLDYLGPLYVKQVDGTRTKVWISLFTCATIRALHLEVVDDLTTEQCLLALRRFIASEGKPKLIISDNAKQFHLADQVLRKVWARIQELDVIQEFSARQGIAWRFITDLAPWMGGFYERLVALVKRALMRAIDRKSIGRIQLQTLVCEISQVLNSRPLVYSEHEVGEMPLTPNHLMMRSVDQFPDFELPVDYQPRPLTAEGLVSKWKSCNKSLNVLWDLWHRDYLLSLRETFWDPNQRNTSDTSPKVGTVVQICEAKQPRGTWRLGRIQRQIPSSDGLCRSVEVKLPNGNLLNRSIRHLYPLEYCEPQPANTSSTPSSQHLRPRLPRIAVFKAKTRIRDILSEEQDAT